MINLSYFDFGSILFITFMLGMVLKFLSPTQTSAMIKAREKKERQNNKNQEEPS